MKKALRNLFWIAVVLGAIGLLSDNCSRAEAHDWPGGKATFGKAIFDVDEDPRCWEGNCVIYSYNGVISQECDTFCNFYCYNANYVPHCGPNGCVNVHQHYCCVDGEPHLVRGGL